MTTYKGINGFAVQSVASDPSPLDEGQVWYNNATYAFKLASVTTAGTWASGGNLTTAKIFHSGDGPQTAGWAAGGGTSPGDAQNNAQQYNGTSWTNIPNLPSSRFGLAGAGTQTGSLVFGGNPGNNSVNLYNGTSWSNVNSLSTGRVYINRAGISTSALAMGGASPDTTSVTNTEEYDGSTWTSGGSLSTARLGLAGSGIQTSGLGFGGKTTVVVANTEEYSDPSFSTKTITTS